MAFFGKDEAQKLTLDRELLPRHVAIIMDGNGRWAQRRGMPRSFGHKAGVEALREIIRHSDHLGIQALTIYAFSTENWKRSAEEVGALMGLLLYAIVRRTDSLAAGAIVHCLYNISLLLISFMGLGGLFSGLSLVSCALRLAGTAVFVAGLRRLWRARRPAMPEKSEKKPAKLRLSQREWGMAAGAAALMILSQIIAGVMKG